MPDISASLVFLADLPLYKDTKPYHVLVQSVEGKNPAENHKHHNLEWESHSMTISDIRDQSDEFTVEKTGFEFATHTSKCLNFDAPTAVEEYKRETEEHLKQRFNAVYTFCYETRVRILP